MTASRNNAPSDQLIAVIDEALKAAWREGSVGGESPARRIAEVVEDHYRALPVEQRMEAMGMVRVSPFRHEPPMWMEVDVA